jgi:hypothetical protein
MYSEFSSIVRLMGDDRLRLVLCISAVAAGFPLNPEHRDIVSPFTKLITGGFLSRLFASEQNIQLY